MWNRYALYAVITTAILVLVATVVHAMTVSPVVVDLQTSGSRMSQVVTIENKYARPILLEMSAQEAEYTDEGVKGTGKQTDDLLVFPPQAQIAAGGTQAVRIQYVGDPELATSKHYFVTVAQLPVKLPEGESAVQLLYTFQVVTGVSMPGKRPNIIVDSAEAYMGGDNKPRLLLNLSNDADTYGYLSSGSLRIVQKDDAGKEVFKRTMTGDQISQEIGFGLVGAGQKRRMSSPIILPQMGVKLRLVSQRIGKPSPLHAALALMSSVSVLSIAQPVQAQEAPLYAPPSLWHGFDLRMIPAGSRHADARPRGVRSAPAVDPQLRRDPLTAADAAAGQAAPSEAGAAPAAPATEEAPPVKLNTTGRDIILSAPLRDGAFLLGEVTFQLAADDVIRVETKSLLAAIGSVVSPERLTILQNALAGTGFVPLDQMGALGYPIRYDPATISLAIAIPAETRTARDLSLRRFEDTTTGEFYEPARFSGYINLRSFTDYIWSGGGNGFRAPTVLIDSAIRYKGVVLENEGTLRFDSGDQRTFTREGTRLVYDDRRRYVRFSAGDLLTSGRGFSGSPQIAGLSATRVYSIVDPLRNVQPRGDRSFTLTRGATVEAVINGQPVRRIRLEPGVYNVSDFPFVQGTNNVQFNIQDDAGGVQTIAFSQFFDRTLLAPGLSEFSIQAGILNPFNGGARDYQFSEPAASGWYRRGINDVMTLGGNFNVRESGVTAGGEVTLATAIGILGADVAVSKVDDVGTGFAANLGLQKTFGGYTTTSRSISASAEYRSPNFANPGTLIAQNRIAWNLAASYAQPVGKSQFISLSGNYGITRGPFRDEKSARLTYGYSINTRLNLTVDATYDDRDLFGKEYGVRATLLIRFGPRSTGFAEADSRTKRARVGYQTARGEGVGSWTASGDVDVGEDDVGLNAGFNYVANRAELGVNHTTVYELTGQRTDSQRTSLRVGTAIAFADGKFALSRPIYDSFAMVAPHKSLGGAAVLIDPREGHYTAKSGTFGPAVDPNLAAYIRRTLTYDVPEAPIGYDLGAASAKMQPPYRGGYLITAGSDYSVTTLGVLLGLDGTPVSLLAGKATELGVDDPKTLTIFTNRTGRFGASGMRPGRWRIDMPTEPPTSVEIEIPADSLGVVRLGEIRLGDR